MELPFHEKISKILYLYFSKIKTQRKIYFRHLYSCARAFADRAVRCTVDTARLPKQQTHPKE